ncbi:NAD-dependent succinate-semialdehyde dehydrogenase [Roseovarius sp. 2305UL8-3]|uniref:NAD-dependent succinate-semialdehyde dehydrogenase n=1 Tax=Roseovarius conchicola TaxID=3121636 RepID=UPI00352734E5
MSYTYQQYINGSWFGVDGRESVPVTNPATRAEIGQLPRATDEDLENAASAAGRAFATWKALPALERQRFLDKTADILTERQADIARLLTSEQGKPFDEAFGEVGAVVDFLRWFGEEGRRVYGRTIPSADGVTDWSVRHEPVGPAFVIGPWNFPVSEIGGHMSAALAAGCPVILKAPQDTPGAPQEIIRAFADAGLPDGVVNLVAGRSGHVSDFLIAHPAVRKVSFTGSTPVGIELAQKTIARLKHSTMELGGNAPVIVGKTADIDAAARLVAMRKFRNAGQVCVSPNRIYVHDSVHDRFVAEFLRHVGDINIGNGLEDGITMGPLVNARRVGAISDLVEQTLDAGAELVTGGTALDQGPCYWAPTVLANVPETAPAFVEEIFGPVAPISRFTDDADMLARANDVPVGLASYVFSNDRVQIDLFKRGLAFGCVGINTLLISSAETPFGGVKDSGYGRVGGQEGLNVFFETKFVAERISAV